MGDLSSDKDDLGNEDPVDAGLAEVGDWIPAELEIQRRKETIEILRLMELRISSGQFDQSVDPDFFYRKNNLKQNSMTSVSEVEDSALHND